MIEKAPEIPRTEVNSTLTSSHFNKESIEVVEDARKSERRLYEVVIAGVPLRLKSSHDDETVNELVRLVDAKINEALPLTKTGSIQNASILASLHLAEELLVLKRKAKNELANLEAKTLKVISDLENSRSAAGSSAENQ